MKTGFNDPIRDSVKKEKKKSPWDFRCPPYDERSSCYVNAGSHHGLGFRNPVGHSGNSKSRAATLPFGRVSTMETFRIPKENLPLDIDR